MKKYGTNSEVVHAWAHKQDGPIQNGKQSIFWDDSAGRRILYSYGYHFPLGILREDGIALLNGDYYSSTTSRHQELARRAAKRGFTVSFIMLRQAGIDPLALDLKIIDFEDDESGKVKDKRDIPSIATEIHHITDNYYSDAPYYTWHRAATVVFCWKHKHYLAAFDDRSYFVSQLPRKVLDVQDAYKALKPEQVRKFEERENVIVSRQGEWFFIPLKGVQESKKFYKSMTGNFVLPREDNNSNPHTADRGCYGMALNYPEHFTELFNGADFARNVIVSGRIRHPEHSTLRLSSKDKPQFFAAFPNTAIRSWSNGATGTRID